MFLALLLVHPYPSLPYFYVTFSQFSLFSHPEDGGSRLLLDIGMCLYKGAWCHVPEGNLYRHPTPHVSCCLFIVKSNFIRHSVKKRSLSTPQSSFGPSCAVCGASNRSKCCGGPVFNFMVSATQVTFRYILTIECRSDLFTGKGDLL
jgi:hypothetical protein